MKAASSPRETQCKKINIFTSISLTRQKNYNYAPSEFKSLSFSELTQGKMQHWLIKKNTWFRFDINKINFTQTVLVCLATITSGSVKINPQFIKCHIKIFCLYVLYSPATDARLSHGPVPLHASLVPGVLVLVIVPVNRLCIVSPRCNTGAVFTIEWCPTVVTGRPADWALLPTVTAQTDSLSY